MDTKEREKLITDAAAEFEAGLQSKAEQFETAHAERKLTISVIEALWGESRKLSAKKGNQWHFGMKAHTGAGAASGMAHSVVADTNLVQSLQSPNYGSSLGLREGYLPGLGRDTSLACRAV
jgi:IS5 family transposase